MKGWTRYEMPLPKKQAERLRKQERKKARRASPIPSKWAMEKREELLKKSNEAEEYIEALLRRSGLLYTREFVVHCFNDYIMDFVVEMENGLVALEVDGSQHFTPKGQKADRKRERHILTAGEVSAFVRLSWPVALKMTMPELRHKMEAAIDLPGAVILLY